MLIGPRLPGVIYNQWRFVEDDLYGIAARVQEYDEKARLIIGPDRALAIARWIPIYEQLVGGGWVLAKWCKDPYTGESLYGEPDARVLLDMRLSDSYLIRSMREYQAKMWDGIEEADRKRLQQRVEDEMPAAEKLAWAAHRKDLGRQDMISVPAGV